MQVENNEKIQKTPRKSRAITAQQAVTRGTTEGCSSKIQDPTVPNEPKKDHLKNSVY